MRIHFFLGTDDTEITEPVLRLTRHSPTWMTRKKIRVIASAEGYENTRT